MTSEAEVDAAAAATVLNLDRLFDRLDDTPIVDYEKVIVRRAAGRMQQQVYGGRIPRDPRRRFLMLARRMLLRRTAGFDRPRSV